MYYIELLYALNEKAEIRLSQIRSRDRHGPPSPFSSERSKPGADKPPVTVIWSLQLRIDLLYALVRFGKVIPHTRPGFLQIPEEVAFGVIQHSLSH